MPQNPIDPIGDPPQIDAGAIPDLSFIWAVLNMLFGGWLYSLLP